MSAVSSEFSPGALISPGCGYDIEPAPAQQDGLALGDDGDGDGSASGSWAVGSGRLTTLCDNDLPRCQWAAMRQPSLSTRWAWNVSTAEVVLDLKTSWAVVGACEAVWPCLPA